MPVSNAASGRGYFVTTCWQMRRVVRAKPRKFSSRNDFGTVSNIVSVDKIPAKLHTRVLASPLSQKHSAQRVCKIRIILSTTVWKNVAFSTPAVSAAGRQDVRHSDRVRAPGGQSARTAAVEKATFFPHRL